MWGFLAKILSKIGLKAAEKGAEQVAKKTAISAAQKIAGAAKTASAINPQDKSFLSKVLNVVTGDLGRNLESTGSTLGRAGQQPKGTWYNKVKAAIVGDLDQAAKKGAVQAQPAGIDSFRSALGEATPETKRFGSMKDILQKIQPKESVVNPPPMVRSQGIASAKQTLQGRKIADTVNNILFGEGFGSNVVRRTMLNAAQQGIFSGSDVGQPEKDKWGILGNSLLGGVAGASFDTMQQQFDNKQMLTKMLNEFNPADESFKNFQPAMLGEINKFRDYVVGVGANKKGLQKGKYNSQEMLDITDKYSRLQNHIDGYIKADQQYRKDYTEFNKNYSKYDPIDFKLGSEYFLKTGSYPQEGILTPAEVNPTTFFQNLSVTNKDSWKPTREDMPYEIQSALTPEQKRALAGTYFYTNPGIQKYILRNDLPQWKQQYANDPELTKMFTDPKTGQLDDMKFAEFMTAYNYGDQIEQNKVDWDKKVRYMQERKDTAKKSAKELEEQKTKLGYSVVQDYPYDNNQSGPAIVFNKTVSENVPTSMLRNATGEQLESDGDVAPTTFEYVDNKGNLVVTANVREGGSQVRKRLFINPNQSKGLLEQYFPGVASDPKAAAVFTPKNKAPVGIVRSNEVSGVDPKTGKLAVFDSNTKQFIRWAD